MYVQLYSQIIIKKYLVVFIQQVYIHQEYELVIILLVVVCILCIAIMHTSRTTHTCSAHVEMVKDNKTPGLILSHYLLSRRLTCH